VLIKSYTENGHSCGAIWPRVAESTGNQELLNRAANIDEFLPSLSDHGRLVSDGCCNSKTVMMKTIVMLETRNTPYNTVGTEFTCVSLRYLDLINRLSHSGHKKTRLNLHQRQKLMDSFRGEQLEVKPEQ
jgi:hypothetical protein